MTVPISRPYPFFVDSDGSPLDAGKIYIGAAGLDAETNPLAVYWDSDATITASQPVRTIAGTPDNGGSAGSLYVVGDYSITVRDKNDVLVYSKLNADPNTLSTDVTPEYFSGTGFQTVFTLDNPPSNRNLLTINIDGVVQHRSTYTIVGSDVTLGQAPPIGVNNIETLSQSTTDITNVPAANVNTADGQTAQDKFDQAAYSTRALFVADVAAAKSWPEGEVVFAAGFAYQKTTGATDISDLLDWVPYGSASPEHWSSNVLPGVTSMGSAINSAWTYSANTGLTCFMQGEVYATAIEIVAKEGMQVRGTGNWSGGSSTSSASGVTVIKWIGTAASNSCIVRVSSLPVGTEGAANDQIENIAITHITVDGGDIAEYGFYFNRSWTNNQFDYLSAASTKLHGLWVGNCWNGSPTNWMAYKNINAGITLGINTFGWSQCTVDQSVCTSFFGRFSGHSVDGGISTVPQNAFNEAGGEDLEYGIGVGDSRGLVMVNAQGLTCGGAGIYLTPDGQNPVKFVGGYVEENGVSSGASQEWGIWYNPTTSTQNVVIDGMHMGGSAYVKIAGTPNTTRYEASIKLLNLTSTFTVDADHKYYRMVDCTRDATIVGTDPTSFIQRNNGDMNRGPIGVVSFYTTGTAVTILQSEGAVSGVTRSSTGEFVLTLSETMGGSAWVVAANSAADNRYVRAHTFTTTTCGISHKSCTSNAAADPAGATNAIRLLVYPDFT